MMPGSRMNQQDSEYCLHGQVVNSYIGDNNVNNDALDLVEDASSSSKNDKSGKKNDRNNKQQQHQRVQKRLPHTPLMHQLSSPQPAPLSSHPQFTSKQSIYSTKSSKNSFFKLFKMKASSPFRSKSSEKSSQNETGSNRSRKSSPDKVSQSALRLLETSTSGAPRSPPRSAPASTNLKDLRKKGLKDQKAPSKLSLVNLLKRKSSSDKKKKDQLSIHHASTAPFDSYFQPLENDDFEDDDTEDDGEKNYDKDEEEEEDDDEGGIDGRDKTIENLPAECGGNEWRDKEDLLEESGRHNKIKKASKDSRTQNEARLLDPNNNSNKNNYNFNDNTINNKNFNKNIRQSPGNSEASKRTRQASNIEETVLDVYNDSSSSSSVNNNNNDGKSNINDIVNNSEYNDIADVNKTFVLEVELRDGKDLVIKDRSGTSDPYVKFKLNNKVVYKSCTIDKDLNPVWNESFLIPLKTLQDPILVQVYDYDLGPKMDDFMGQAYLQPSMLAVSQPVELNLMLEEKKGSKKFTYMGYVRIKCTLQRLDEVQIAETRARLESYTLRSQKNLMVLEKGKKGVKKRFKNEPLGTLNILLVEGADLIAMDDNGFSDPYVKFQLGQEKFKSKCKMKTLNPRWLESFDFDWWTFEQSELEISVYDHDVGGRDDILGRTKLDIRKYEPNKTHNLKVDLEDGAGHLIILLTLCPYQHPNIHSQFPLQQERTLRQQILQLPQQQQDEYQSLVKHLDYFSFLDDHELEEEISNLNKTFTENYNFMSSSKEVGKLIVTIHQARDLVAADLGGKSDPYCVIELINSRLQTNTVYKSLNPRWRATYILDVTDVHAALEVTVYDYDKSKRSEFLGKIVIPLMRVNNNVKKWYQLKDKKLTQLTRGAVQLQLSLHYNPIKAVVRTFNPREEKLLVPEKTFKLGTLKSNTDRVFKLIEGMVRVSNFVNSLFDWKEKLHGTIAFVAFVIVVWNAELFMVPIAVVLLLLKNLMVLNYSGKLQEEEEPQVLFDQDKKELDSIKKSKEDKKGQGLRERLQSIQDVCLQVQETMDAVACVGERVKNTFLWKVPWLSILAILTMLVISTILYFIPLRLIVLAWGVNRFTRRMRVGDRIPNNEVLDFLSRVPSDIELVEYRELKES